MNPEMFEEGGGTKTARVGALISISRDGTRTESVRGIDSLGNNARIVKEQKETDRRAVKIRQRDGVLTGPENDGRLHGGDARPRGIFLRRAGPSYIPPHVRNTGARRR